MPWSVPGVCIGQAVSGRMVLSWCTVLLPVPLLEVTRPPPHALERGRRPKPTPLRVLQSAWVQFRRCQTLAQPPWYYCVPNEPSRGWQYPIPLHTMSDGTGLNIARGALDDFVRQEEDRGAELANGSDLERALVLLITQRRLEA